jgi:hypothetical protein
MLSQITKPVTINTTMKLIIAGPRSFVVIFI